MDDDMITMADMQQVYEVTDEFGIDREALTVELTKEDPGRVLRTSKGVTEITLPLTTAVQDWLPTLRVELQKLG